MVMPLHTTIFPVRRDPAAGDDPPAGGDPSGGGDPAGDPGAGGTILTGDSAGQQPFQIPEKFMVKGADDQPDFKAIVEKMGQSYTHLEKRLGTGEVPPKTADEYQLGTFLPEGFEVKPEAMKPIMGKFHELGLTNAQAQGIMGLFGQRLTEGIAAEKASMEAGMATLKEIWGDAYKDKLADAETALATYAADPKLKALLLDPKRSNDPALIQLLAAVGADLREDRPANDMDSAAMENIDEIRKSKAYTDPKDPGHEDAVRKVNEAYQRGYRANR